MYGARCAARCRHNAGTCARQEKREGKKGPSPSRPGGIDRRGASHATHPASQPAGGGKEASSHFPSSFPSSSPQWHEKRTLEMVVAVSRVVLRTLCPGTNRQREAATAHTYNRWCAGISFFRASRPRVRVHGSHWMIPGPIEEREKGNKRL